MIRKLSELISSQEGYSSLQKVYNRDNTIELGSISGSLYSMVAAETIKEQGGIHIFLEEDRGAAAFLSNDLYALLDPERIMFLPTGYKRSVQFGQEETSGIVQRTAALNAIKNFSKQSDYLIICTYPEALIEKVTDKEQLRKSTIKVSVGDNLTINDLEQALLGYGFQRVDFVYNPGQYSIRGGILDIFSFSSSKPFRLDFFGDQIESCRTFELSSQLSIDRLESVEIVPNLKNAELAKKRVSFAQFTGDATYWVDDLDYSLRRFTEIRTKLLKELDEPKKIEQLVTGTKGFLEDISECRVVLRRGSTKERMPDSIISFDSAPQPTFNKNFELLAQDLVANQTRGYTTYILSENKAQIERLENVLGATGVDGALFSPLSITLHEGFISHQMRACLYTDHQLFDRYHRYRIRDEVDRSESITIAELNALEVGDYVVHIDHGVGRFGGLVRTTENGKIQEAVKLTYKDNDVLLVNVHSLHRIARYKDKDSEQPRIYKLGSGVWQRMKTAAKRSIKDIARELIALYARRKSSPGFAFSPDTYMQEELEASFEYEDTPDQTKATEDVKVDMESTQPMDRLICGDVGFGKTEVAIRAAFKATADSKQVAILVPTTILSLQHYRTFSRRLKDFPVKIEHLSRSKSTKEAKQIIQDLADGKIDILIGTHKILGKEVRFKDLGLLIIDEEHKFGVSAKEKLRQLSISVDTLTMTATPIPRTLQFSLMGSRDMSIITTPPPNRQPIQTESHTFDEEIVKEAIEAELARNGQVYFVHNRVENIGHIAKMIERLCPQARTIVGHGQMSPQELEKKIMDFIYGEYDVLVATTIIENGIDIPNANTIIINNAHHFGLSDLHQLRGRVGRSNRKAYCYLFSPPDELLSSDARRRLRAIEEFTDLGSGFNIAMQDLDIRGAGNLLGAQQSGFIADIGFETYQKILNEAMDELRDEGLIEQKDDNKDSIKNFISDVHIDIDEEAIIPSDYVEQTAEKIKLYRKIDNITEESELVKLAGELHDRFGKIPPQTEALFNVLRLRWAMMRLGFERVKIKNGLMILGFISNSDSHYYKSGIFMALLRHVTSNQKKYVFKQRGDKLALTVREIAGLEQAVKELQSLLTLASGAKGRTDKGAQGSDRSVDR